MRTANLIDRLFAVQHTLDWRCALIRSFVKRAVELPLAKKEARLFTQNNISLKKHLRRCAHVEARKFCTSMLAVKQKASIARSEFSMAGKRPSRRPHITDRSRRPHCTPFRSTRLRASIERQTELILLMAIIHNELHERVHHPSPVSYHGIGHG